MLSQLDTEILLWINSHNNSFLDFVMWWASDRFIWIPLYLFLLFIIIKHYKKDSWKIILSVIVLILITDQTANFFKEHFERLRPCHDLQLASIVHIVNNYCGGSFGYMSSHASNSAGLTTFCFLLLPSKFNYLKIVLVLYCLLLCYSRIYLAAHFPSDVLRGILTGVIVAFIIFKIDRAIINLN